MNSNQKNFIICLFIALSSLFVFMNGLNVHGFEFRDDEVFYYKSTNEMLQSGDILSPKYFGEDRFQKPILFYWLILISYKLFGVSWFSARLVSCFFASATLVISWLMAKSLFNKRVAHLSVLILMTMPLFFRHAKNAVPDITLNFFIVLALYFFIRFYKGNFTSRHTLYFFMACALGFMIKGFAALIVPIITVIVYSVYKREWNVLKKMRFSRGAGVLVLIVLPWFLYMLKVHGIEYFQYMWVNETSDRLLKVEGGNFFLIKIKNFFEHAVFYFQIILQQFAPWSIMSVLGIGFAIFFSRKKEAVSESFVFLLSWVFVVYTFFSFMYFTISHYMLVMTTPVAILTSYFLLYPFESNKSFDRFVQFVRKFYFIIIISLLWLVYVFILTFFAGIPTYVLIMMLLIYLAVLIFVLRSQSLVIAPTILGILIAMISYQTAYLSELGLTTHTTLRKFAQTINRQGLVDYSIGVGSHDLHEKEFQVYFTDIKVEKVANDNDQYTTYMLNQLFGKNESVYCLITEKDYNKYLKDIFGGIQIVQQEYMLRKRLQIDSEFFKALVTLDRRKIYEYFMENVVLVKREKHA